MISKMIIVANEQGLHARPAALFVQTAQKFKSMIFVSLKDKKVNAKSMLGILSLGVTKNTQVLLEADGEDETAAMEALTYMVEGNFREEHGEERS